LPEESFERILESSSVQIERIISKGHKSPNGFWYDQDHHEWVVVLQGAARLAFEANDKLVELKPGDYVNIPAHHRHRVEWTSREELTIWLAVHYSN